MQMHTHQTKNVVPPELVIGGASVEAVNNCRLLGVTISDTMNWLPQCEKVANKWKMKYFEENYRLLRQHLEGGADKIILLAREYVFNVSYVAFDGTALVGPVLGGKWVDAE
jgi:hypothetical protein